MLETNQYQVADHDLELEDAPSSDLIQAVGRLEELFGGQTRR